MRPENMNLGGVNYNYDKGYGYGNFHDNDYFVMQNTFPK